MFSALDLCFGSGVILLVLGRSAVDVILDFLSVFILGDCVFTLFCSNVPAVAAYDFFFSVQKFRGHIHIMLVRRRDLHRVHKPGILIHAQMSFVSEMPGIPFFGMSIRIPLFFVEEGAEMIVESTIVPFFRISSRLVSVLTSSAKNCL